MSRNITNIKNLVLNGAVAFHKGLHLKDNPYIGVPNNSENFKKWNKSWLVEHELHWDARWEKKYGTVS